MVKRLPGRKQLPQTLLQFPQACLIRFSHLYTFFPTPHRICTWKKPRQKHTKWPFSSVILFSLKTFFERLTLGRGWGGASPVQHQALFFSCKLAAQACTTTSSSLFPFIRCKDSVTLLCSCRYVKGQSSS